MIYDINGRDKHLYNIYIYIQNDIWDISWSAVYHTRKKRVLPFSLRRKIPFRGCNFNEELLLSNVFFS